MLKIEKQILDHEGFSEKAYLCTAGKLTIGVGRNLDDKGISRDEAIVLLRNDIAECEADLFKIFGQSLFNLDDNRRHALIDMRFNLGPIGFRNFKRTIKAVQDKDFARAAEEMKDSLWYEQVGKRGKKLCKMMVNGGDNGYGS